MSKDQLRSAFLDRGMKRPSDVVEVIIGGEKIRVEVRALAMRDNERIIERDYSEKKYGVEHKLVQACCYDPEDGEQVFEPSDLESLAKAPAVVGGWFNQLTNAIGRVHGQDIGQPGVSVSDERLDEFREMAGKVKLEIQEEEGIPDGRKAKYAELLEEIEAGALALSSLADSGDPGNAMGALTDA